MALFTSDSRHRIKRSIVTGSTPTFKAQEDFTDGSFSIFDCRPGEFFWNMVDERLFIMSLTGITEIGVFASGSTGDFCSTGIKTSAVSGCSPVTIYDSSTKVAHFASSAFTLALNQQIRSDNGDSIIEMDFGGAADKIYLSPDNTFQNYMLFNGPADSFELFAADDVYIESAVDIAIVGFDNNLLLMKGDSNVIGIFALTSSSSSTDFVASEGGIAIGDSSANLSSPAAFQNAQVIINSRSATFNSGITASVIIGGSSITALSSDTVYTTNINVQEDKGIAFGTGLTESRFTQDIGDWNMDLTGQITVAHGLSATEWKTVRNTSVIIRNDADTDYYDMSFSFVSTSIQIGISSFDSTNFTLDRRAGGDFDSIDFNSTSYNRGFISFWYQPD